MGVTTTHVPGGSRRVSGRVCGAGTVVLSRCRTGGACGRTQPPSSGTDTGAPSAAARGPAAPHREAAVCALPTSQPLASSSQTVLPTHDTS